MSLLDNLPHRCNIYRRSRSTGPDDLGVSVDSLILEKENVACWEQQASSSESRDWQKRGITVSKKIFFTADPEVTEGHVIVITYRRGAAVPVNFDDMLDVKSAPDPDASATLGVVWKVMAEYKKGSKS